MKRIEKDHIYFGFDKEFPPAERIHSGETVCFKTKDCYDEQIDVDKKDFALLDMKRNNPVTGPLYIEEAQPGDILKVEIQDIAVADHGVMCVRLNQGVYEVEGCHCRRFSICDEKILFDEGIEIPVKPMIGVIGTCPEIPCDTQAPGRHGGNLDIRDLGIGSTVYLPVAVKGAGLSIGDCHAVQGDGETAICAMEVSAQVTVKVSVLKEGLDRPLPFIETEAYIYTAGDGVTLDEASVQAAQNMHHYIIKECGLTDAQAAMLLSLVGNLRISQVVNPRKGCMMQVPKKYLRKYK